MQYDKNDFVRKQLPHLQYVTVPADRLKNFKDVCSYLGSPINTWLKVLTLANPVQSVMVKSVINTFEIETDTGMFVNKILHEFKSHPDVTALEVAKTVPDNRYARLLLQKKEDTVQEVDSDEERDDETE